MILGPSTGLLMHTPFPVSRGAAGFTPEDIPDLQFWLDATKLSSLFQDQAGTTPVTADGDPIGQWQEQVNSWHLLSPSVSGGDNTNRPTYKTGIINGLPVVRMDGSLTFLLRTTSIAIDTEVLTVIVVAKRNNFIGANEGLVSLSNTGADDFSNPAGAIVAHSAPDAINLSDSRNNEVMFDVAHPGNGQPFIWTSRYDGTENAEFLNGVAAGGAANAGTVGAFNIRRIIIGFRYTGANDTSLGNPNNYDYAEVLIFDRDISNAEHTEIITYLKDKWGIA